MMIAITPSLNASTRAVVIRTDDQWLVTAGNHGDVGIFDRETGRLLCYTRTSAAAFYVEKVWINGSRMIFTTDTGVMFDGILSASKN